MKREFKQLIKYLLILLLAEVGGGSVAIGEAKLGGFLLVSAVLLSVLFTIGPVNWFNGKKEEQI